MFSNVLDNKFHEDSVVSTVAKKNLHNFYLLEVKGYAENIRKLPVTFHEPVLPQKVIFNLST